MTTLPEMIERGRRWGADFTVFLGELKDAADVDQATKIGTELVEYIQEEGFEAAHIMVLVFSTDIAKSLRATVAEHQGAMYIDVEALPDASWGVVQANRVCAAMANNNTFEAASISSDTLRSGVAREIANFIQFFPTSVYQLSTRFDVSPVEIRDCCAGGHDHE